MKLDRSDKDHDAGTHGGTGDAPEGTCPAGDLWWAFIQVLSTCPAHAVLCPSGSLSRWELVAGGSPGGDAPEGACPAGD